MNLLQSARGWRELAPGVGEVAIRVQSVTVELVTPALGGPPLRLALDHRGGAITARIEQEGWLGCLDPSQREVVETAVSGFSAMAAAKDTGAPNWDAWVRFWESARADPPDDPANPVRR